MISNFQELLDASKQQADAQRLLFLFAGTSDVKSNKSKKAKEYRGHLVPVMCVDKLPQEISSFAALVAEADSISKEWQLMIVASLSGEGSTPPTTEQADPYLNRMTNEVASGADLSRYLVIDRNEEFLVLSAMS